MHIAIITHDVVQGDGQGRVNKAVALNALRRGHSVDLFADKADSDLVELGARWFRVEKRLRQFRLFTVYDFSTRAGRAVRSTGVKYDIINGNGYSLTGRHDVNSVHFVHSSWLNYCLKAASGRSILWALYQLFFTKVNCGWEQAAFGDSRHVVAVSEMVRKELIAIGIPDDKITVINNGVDVDQFRPGAAKRNLFDLPDSVPIALFAGDLRSNRKNLDTVLNALRLTAGLHLAVAGSIEGSPYPRMADELGVADRTHFLGYRENTPDLMRSVDFLICPSRYDPFALVVLEAMATGLPVISAPTVGASYLIDDGSGIVVSDTESVSELADAMLRLATNTEIRRSMGRQARQTAENHSWSVVGDRYLDLFSRICSKSRSAEVPAAA